MSYISPSTITQKYLTQLGDEHDSTLQTLIDNAESAVNNLLGFTFVDFPTVSILTARAIRWYGGEYVYLPAHKSGTLGAVVRSDNAYTIDSSTYTQEPGSIYGTVEVNRTLYSRSSWSPGRYSITAEWGYGPVPAGVQEVMAELVVNIWRAKDAGHFSDVVGVPGANAVGYSKALTAFQRETLMNVRRRYLGGISI